MSALESITTPGTSLPRPGEDDAKYMMELMMYLPLAYFCNDLLQILNFIRECPMLCLKNEISALLSQSFISCCNYIVSESKHIRSTGHRYLMYGGVANNNTNTNTANSTTAKNTSDPLYCVRGLEYVTVTSNDLDFKPSTVNNNNNTSNNGTIGSGRQLDHMYALATVKLLIPHILLCVDQIYPHHNADGSTTNSSNYEVFSSYKPDQLPVIRIVKYPSEAKNILSHTSYDTLLTCWKLFEEGKLLSPLLTATASSTMNASSSHSSAHGTRNISTNPTKIMNIVNSTSNGIETSYSTTDNVSNIMIRDMMGNQDSADSNIVSTTTSTSNIQD